MEQRHHRSPSNSMLVPYAHRQLAVAPATASASSVRVPRGWDVEEVPRPDGSRSDRVHLQLHDRLILPSSFSRIRRFTQFCFRCANNSAFSLSMQYYYEPRSGRKFRSIKEVHRYLNGEPNYSLRPNSRMLVPFQRSRGYRYRRMMVSGGKLLRMDNEGSKNHLAVVRQAPDILPDGWIVEEVPRKYMNFTDKYYYEPETGVKFRSLVAIERHLAELDENAPLSKTLEEIMENKPLARAFKLDNKSSTRRKKDASREKSQASSFVEPPIKVTWVLTSAQGDSWNPFISEALVPDAVKQQWTNRFMLFMKDRTSNFQNFQA